MNDVLTDRIDETVEPSPGPGPMLRDARRAKQLDQLEVAQQLNLDLWVIDALERDDHGRLPPATFVRGYLRSYARLVELPVDRVLAEYERVLRTEPVPERPRRAQSRSVQRDETPLRRAAVVGLLMLLAGVAGWWSLGTHRAVDSAPPVVAGSESVSPVVVEPTVGRAAEPTANAPAVGSAPQDKPGAMTVETSVPAPVTAPAAASPGRAMPSRQPAVPAEPAPVRAEPEVREAAAPASGEPTPSEAAAQVARAAAPAEPVAPVPSPVPPAAGANDADVLVLKYEADCWTAIQDADGKRLAYDLVKAGAVLNLQGKAPFRVTLGNAPAVNVQINGEPFDTVRFSRGRIARFEIPAGA